MRLPSFEKASPLNDRLSGTHGLACSVARSISANPVHRPAQTTASVLPSGDGTIFSGSEFTPTCRPAGVSFQPLNRVFGWDGTTLAGPSGSGCGGAACPRASGAEDNVTTAAVMAAVANRFRRPIEITPEIIGD